MTATPATLIYLHNNVTREDEESEETDKPTSSAISTDCNKNEMNQNKEAKKVDVEARETNSCPTISKETEIAETANNNDNYPDPVPPRQVSQEVTVSEKPSSNVTCSNTNTDSTPKNVAEAAESSGSGGKREIDLKLIGSNNNAAKHRVSSSDEGESKNNNKQSYQQIRSKRKNLIKIEKLTDSDSRSRDKMRRRGLSPPSSSDEENLYIGWIAYPASITSLRRKGRKTKSRREAWIKAAKFIFYPVTKVCQKCVKHKVGVVGK